MRYQEEGREADKLLTSHKQRTACTSDLRDETADVMITKQIGSAENTGHGVDEIAHITESILTIIKCICLDATILIPQEKRIREDNDKSLEDIDYMYLFHIN